MDGVLDMGWVSGGGVGFGKVGNEVVGGWVVWDRWGFVVWVVRDGVVGDGCGVGWVVGRYGGRGWGCEGCGGEGCGVVWGMWWWVVGW